MNGVKGLWASVQGDPAFMRRLNGWLTLFWVAMIPISYELGWLKSVVYVSALSLWALVAGHWSTWQAARVEVTQQREREKLEDSPIEERVVEKIVQDDRLGADTMTRPAASSDRRSPTIAHGTFRVDQRVRLLRKLPSLPVDSVGLVRGVSAGPTGLTYVVRFASVTRVVAGRDLVSSPALMSLSRSLDG